MAYELSPKAVEILACARTLIANGGYHGFSYADISDVVRISKASIHHHFPSKADLVRAVVSQYREDARVGLQALSAQLPDPVAQLRAYTGYWAECIRDATASFCVCAMLAAELPAIPADVADEVRGHFRELSSWLAAVLTLGVSQGAFRLGSTAEAEALTFMATVHGAMLSARAQGDADLFEKIVEPAFRRLVPAS